MIAAQGPLNGTLGMSVMVVVAEARVNAGERRTPNVH